MTEAEKQELVDQFKTIAVGNLILDSEKASLTLRQYIKNAVREGVGKEDLKAVLLTDLREGGQIFGSFRKNFRQTVTANVENTARDAMIKMQEAEIKKGKMLWDWVIEPSPNNCPDCLGRSGQTKTMEAWRGLGLPRAGITQCGQYCNCELIKSGVFTESMVNEVKRRYAERIKT